MLHKTNMDEAVQRVSIVVLMNPAKYCTVETHELFRLNHCMFCNSCFVGALAEVPFKGTVCNFRALYCL